MVKVDDGCISMIGSLPVVMTDIVILLEHFHKMAANKYNEDFANILLAATGRLALLDPKDLEKENPLEFALDLIKEGEKDSER